MQLILYRFFNRWLFLTPSLTFVYELITELCALFPHLNLLEKMEVHEKRCGLLGGLVCLFLTHNDW